MSQTIDFRIVVVTDGHWGSDRADYTQWPDYEDWEDLHNDALNRISAIHTDQEVDLVIHNGDAVHDDHALHSELITNFFDKLPTGVSWEITYGNHDWSTETEWQNTYGHSNFRHAETYGNYGFLFPNAGGAPGTASFDPEVQNNIDVNWIESELDSFESQGVDGVFVSHHVPPFTDNDDWGVDLPDVRTQYARDIVRAVFLGHNHEKNFVESKYGTKYVYASRIGGADGTSSNGHSIDTPDGFGVRVFDIMGDE